jgi:diguanylate cyclase (GGDEF)-like protein
MKTLYTFMLKHTVVVLLIIFATGLTITINHLNELAEIQVKETALENAKAFTNVLSEFRSLYTSEVVIAAKNNGLLITHDYKKKLNAIPLPATLTILLSEHLSSQEPGVQSKLYSPFPFPWRLPTGGLRDKFSQNAWESLQNNAERPYFNVETIGTSRSLRFATADLMKKECVNCHNNHPESPKSDWKVGDLRGILEVIIPIQSATLLNNEMVYKTAYLLVVTLFISLLCIAFVLRRLHISNNKYEKINKTLSQEVSYRKNVQNELLTLASIDPLTGIANRREFERVYDTQCLSAVRNQKDISIIMIDIDYYKSYNDNYGHQLGDEILHVVAKEISQYLLRPNDLVARYGGEEFIVLLPETDLEGALHIGEELLAQIKAKRIPHAFSSVSNILTVSAGVSCVIPNQTLNKASLIKNADEAMYLAKNSGRDCIKLYTEN